MKAEQALRKAVDLIPAMLAYWDADQRCVFANSAYSDWFGIDAAKMPGMHLAELLGPGYELSRPFIEGVLRGTPQQMERSSLLPDGRSRHGLAQFTPDVVDGRVVGFVVNVADVTELREREATLRRSTALLERAGAIAKVGGGELDLTTGGVFWTAEMCRILDVDPEQIPPPHRWGDFFEPTALPRYLEVVEQMNQHGTPVDFEAPMITAKGRRIWVRIQSTAELEDGKAVRLLSVHQDITDRKRADEALRLSNERLRLALDATRDAVWDWNLTTDEIYLSPAWYTMLGALPRAGLQRPSFVESFMHPDDVPPAQATAAQSLDSDQGYSVEFRMRHADGSWRWIQSRGRVVERNATGQATRIAGTNSDVHDRRLAEESRNAMEAQLRQAQKMESVGRLAGGVAHDFNNMLLVILGHVEQALEILDDTSEAREDLLAIEGAAVRSADLTRQLLVFARKQAVSTQVIDVNAALARMLSLLQRLIGSHIQVTLDAGTDLWPIRADPSQLDQILTNLAVNARDAIADVGRIVIETTNVHITAQEGEPSADRPSGDYVRLTVTDTGVGMDADTLARVFEPFFTTKASGIGTGLGLATVHGIVTQHGGFIRADSTPGVGSAFAVHLPRHLGDASGDTRVALAAPPQRGRETVMVVEDESRILALTAAILTRAGYTVIPIEDPEDAVRRAQAFGTTIDLLVTDVLMPKLNGRALALRLLAMNPALKVVFISGHTADVLTTDRLPTGTRFLQKPYTSSVLLHTVRETLDT